VVHQQSFSSLKDVDSEEQDNLADIKREVEQQLRKKEELQDDIDNLQKVRNKSADIKISKDQETRELSRKKEKLKEELEGLQSARDKSAEIKIEKRLGLEKEATNLKELRQKLVDEIESLLKAKAENQELALKELALLADNKKKLISEVGKYTGILAKLRLLEKRLRASYAEYAELELEEIRIKRKGTDKRIKSDKQKIRRKYIALTEREKSLTEIYSLIVQFHEFLLGEKKQNVAKSASVKESATRVAKIEKSLLKQSEKLEENIQKTEQARESAENDAAEAKNRLQIASQKERQAERNRIKSQTKVELTKVDLVAKAEANKAKEEKLKIKEIQLRDKEQTLKRVKSELDKKAKGVI
jgi:hypothetical protein